MSRYALVHRTTRPIAGSLVLIALLAIGVPALAGQKTRSGLTRCPKRACVVVDVTPPTVAITTPAPGTEVGGTVTIGGTAADETKLSRVEVSVGSGGFAPASGTSTWTSAVDVAGIAPGSLSITARAFDAAGNTSTVSMAVDIADTSVPDPDPTPPPPDPDPEPVATGSLTLEEITLSNPVYTGDLVPLGKGANAADGSRTAVLYEERFSHQPWLYVRDSGSGASTHVRLPVDTVSGWWLAGYVLQGDDLWILSGNGPLFMRHYRLSGTPLPTGAALVSTASYGDTDSRPGALIGLASGGLFGVWHQQGSTGSQGHRYLYRSPSGAWQTMSRAFMPTRASKDVAVQHPTDGSIWVFSNPDAWSAIGAAHLTETPSGLSVDWSDANYIGAAQGDFDADQENPDLAAVSDASTGQILLAYQSALRKTFSYDPFITGSHPAVARIRADGSRSFVHLPIYVERVSRLGLIADQGTILLAHRPIDPVDLTYDDLAISRYAGGSWTTETLGTMYTPNERVVYTPGGSELGARMADRKIHLFIA